MLLTETDCQESYTAQTVNVSLAREDISSKRNFAPSSGQATLTGDCLQGRPKCGQLPLLTWTLGMS